MLRTRSTEASPKEVQRYDSRHSSVSPVSCRFLGIFGNIPALGTFLKRQHAAVAVVQLRLGDHGAADIHAKPALENAMIFKAPEKAPMPT